jgi:hypothetical protein
VQSQPLYYEWEGGYQYRICFVPILRIWRKGTDTEPKRCIFPSIEEPEYSGWPEDRDDDEEYYPDDDDSYGYSEDEDYAYYGGPDCL